MKSSPYAMATSSLGFDIDEPGRGPNEMEERTQSRGEAMGGCNIPPPWPYGQSANRGSVGIFDEELRKGRGEKECFFPFSLPFFISSESDIGYAD